MCVCIQCFWEWLVEHLKKKPIIRYEQVPFDIDDHVEEELAQETVQLLTPDTTRFCRIKCRIHRAYDKFSNDANTIRYSRFN
jgi:hypothetical protein